MLSELEILEKIYAGFIGKAIGVMAGAILGALHGEGVIDGEDRAQIDVANRLDLTASADAFTRTVTTMLTADRAAATQRDAALAALFAPA